MCHTRETKLSNCFYYKCNVIIITLMHVYVPCWEVGNETDGMTIIVCLGTGTWESRIRLWRPGEILRVTLRSEKKNKGYRL